VSARKALLHWIDDASSRSSTMRPILAIVPLALLLSWFGPSPSGEAQHVGALGLSDVQRPAPLAEPSAAQQVAEAWEAFQWSGILPSAMAEQANPR